MVLFLRDVAFRLIVAGSTHMRTFHPTKGTAGTALGAAALALGGLLYAVGAGAGSILFIGNSFDYAEGSPVQFYRADTVKDLNDEGIGGVPALFKSFVDQAGLNYDVYLETHPDAGLDWHLDNRSALLATRPFDAVIMHGYSILDKDKPGDPALLLRTVKQMTELLRAKNPAVDVRLIATWPRADQIYVPKGAWHDKSVEIMAHDVRAAYDRAAAATPGIKAVIPVGEAWVRAMQDGVAAQNPYQPIEPGKLDLWTYDNYHATTYGYYLDALMLFGNLTGRDPRSLGASECSGYELGLSRKQVTTLEQVASEQLQASGAAYAAAPKMNPAERPHRCSAHPVERLGATSVH
jgi:hypothetical protein